VQVDGGAVDGGDAAAAFAALNGVSSLVTWGGWSSLVHTPYGLDFESVLGSTAPSTGTLDTGGWADVYLDMTQVLVDGGPNDAGALFTAAINQLVIELNTQSTMPEGGPAAPSPATLYIDDIWLQ
jgi:hypothetical protein